MKLVASLLYDEGHKWTLFLIHWAQLYQEVAGLEFYIHGCESAIFFVEYPDRKFILVLFFLNLQMYAVTKFITFSRESLNLDFSTKVRFISGVFLLTVIFCVLGVPETNFHIRFENYTQKKQRSTGRDTAERLGRVPHGTGAQAACKDNNNGKNADTVKCRDKVPRGNGARTANTDQVDSAEHVEASISHSNNEDSTVDANVTEIYTQKTRSSRGAEGVEIAQHTDDNNGDEEEEDPNLTELQVVPFQGHPFIILPNDLTYCCKYGKDCDIQYRRKKQQNAQVPGLQKSDNEKSCCVLSKWSFVNRRITSCKPADYSVIQWITLEN